MGQAFQSDINYVSTEINSRDAIKQECIMMFGDHLKSMFGNDDKLVDVTGKRSKKQTSMMQDHEDLFALSHQI